MNQTKKLTQGAMLLAIIGAMMYLNLRMANFLDTFVILAIPVVISVYSAMHTLRDGMILSVSIGILGLVMGFAASDPMYIVYFPITVLTGIAYSYGVKKDFSRGKLLLTGVVSFVIGEILATFVFLPFLGFPVKQALDTIAEGFRNPSGVFGLANEPVNQALNAWADQLGGRFIQLILVTYILTVVLTGVLEGVLVHILNIFLMRRFRIKEFTRTTLYDLKTSPVVAYGAMLAVILFFFSNGIENETLYGIVMCFSLIGAIILLYFGYLFLMLYGAIVLKRNLTFLFIIGFFFFAPFMVVLLIVAGFLYGSGPLRRYLERKRAQM